MTMTPPIVPSDLRPATLGRLALRSIARAGLVAAHGQYESNPRPAEMARRAFPEDRLAASLLTRAASTPATTTGTGWAKELAPALIADMLAALAPTSAGAALLDQALQLSFGGHGHISLPAFVASASAAAFVAQGAPIPVRQLAVNAPISFLEPRKLAAIAVLTREMTTSSNAQTLVTDCLTRAIGLKLDQVLFGGGADDGAQPAGLRQGITGLSASTKPDFAEACHEDLASERA